MKKLAATAAIALSLSQPLLAEEPREGEVIPSDLERPEYVVPKIDTENFEIGVFVAAISFEDFNSQPVKGASFAYHVTEDVFLEANYGSTEVHDSSFRRLGTPIFTEEKEDAYYYSLSAGMNILPGEIFVLNKYAISSAFYLLAGVGNTKFADDDKFTFNVGGGMRFMPVDWISIRLEARDFIFENEVLGEEELKHNFEFRLGASVYF
jgi:outer membrane beta-barrel protein